LIMMINKRFLWLIVAWKSKSYLFTK